MKGVILFCAILITTSLFAEENCSPLKEGGLKGKFVYKKLIEPLSVIDKRMVDARFQSGKKLLIELLQQKYECMPAYSLIYQCKKKLENAKFPEEVVNRVNTQFAKFNLTFSEKLGDVKETHTSPTYTEWMVERAALVDGDTNFDYYLYRQFEDISKITLKKEDSELWMEFVVSGCEELKYYNVIRRGSDYNFVEYHMLVKLNR